MATFSLACALFHYDKESRFVGDPEQALEAVAAAGFRETELMAEGEEWQAPGPHDSRSIRRALERVDLTPHSIHTPYRNTNLASPDDGIHSHGIAVVADAMRFLAELGGRTAIVHPMGSYDTGKSPHNLMKWGSVVENTERSVSELVRVAEETGVRIALENLFNRPLESMEELRALIAHFPAEHVGLCLDVGHTLISKLSPSAQALVASDRLFALHLQDGDGEDDRHWVPGRGQMDWPALGSALEEIGFDGAWTIEVTLKHTDATVDEIAEACAALREQWEAEGLSTPRSPGLPAAR